MKESKGQSFRILHCFESEKRENAEKNTRERAEMTEETRWRLREDSVSRRE